MITNVLPPPGAAGEPMASRREDASGQDSKLGLKRYFNLVLQHKIVLLGPKRLILKIDILIYYIGKLYV